MQYVYQTKTTCIPTYRNRLLLIENGDNYPSSG